MASGRLAHTHIGNDIGLLVSPPTVWRKCLRKYPTPGNQLVGILAAQEERYPAGHIAGHVKSSFRESPTKMEAKGRM